MIKTKFKIALSIFLTAILLFGLGFYLSNVNIALLNPKGIIAIYERNLMVSLVTLMLSCLLPVLFLTFFIVWRYREGNKSAEYNPTWDHHKIGRFILWALPCTLILTLGIVIWRSTHDLDPIKPLTATTTPVTIQVVALRWKWLFLYPELNIATVNFIELPVKTPINFKLTADAPMNSFWIPQLGGQIYAMSGMVTNLHLMADFPGDYAGLAAEINGSGFSGMKFTARAVSQEDYNTWVAFVKKSGNLLDLAEYKNLTKPSENNTPFYYGNVENDLFNDIIKRYTMPRMY